MLLNAHPEVCTVGELKATSLGDVDRYRCSCRNRIKQCPFWGGVVREMGRRGMGFNFCNPGTDIRSYAGPYELMLLKPLHRGQLFEKVRDFGLRLSPKWRKMYPNFQAVNLALMESVLALTHKHVIVDSSKIGLRLKYLMRNPALDVKIIRLIRDGRAVSLTYMAPAMFADARSEEFRGGGYGEERFALGLPLKEAAMEWRRSNEEAEALLGGINPDNWMEIRYERLCRDPSASLRDIFEFIGVSPGHVKLDFRSVEHHVVGNGMRLDTTSQIECDDRWKACFSESQMAAFNRVAGRMNTALGYS
jgi:hypothetical protein